MSGPPVGWLSPAPEDRRESGSVERLIVRVLLGVGVGVLWVIGLVIMFMNTFGDCFDTEVACEATWVLAGQRAQAMLAVMVVLTIVAFPAFIWVGPRTLGLLLGVSLAIDGVAFVGAQEEPYTIPYFPAALEMIAPALACFIVTAGLGIALVRRTRPRAAP
jgi:hypothetical protein